MKKYSAADKKKYSFGNYKPNKNAKKVTYNGVEYLSKIQCMVLNDLDKRDLEEYLNPTLKKDPVKETISQEIECAPAKPAEAPAKPAEAPVEIVKPNATSITKDTIDPLSFDVL